MKQIAQNRDIIAATMFWNDDGKGFYTSY